MKISNSKKKFLYLISPNKIKKDFYLNLDKILAFKKVKFFQLRIKNDFLKKKIEIGKKIKPICKKHNVKFLINDDPMLAKILKADGCHLGQKDMDIISARKILGKKIIGITCHNSISLAKKALKNNADYLALGAFFPTNTKKVKFKANMSDIKKIKQLTNKPIIAIGGINNKNYKKLLLNNVNFLAISGYIFNNKKYKPVEAIKKLI
ncbi:thiamine phosphate synthase [Candidatus Pelagibacter sp.]|uniref:thiamine phosphate synthase n=1 Tax=Candidatus Pelagibacter sp. TaxID=2024849 RepID=UPI003F845A88